jgi:hypothetical protein
MVYLFLNLYLCSIYIIIDHVETRLAKSWLAEIDQRKQMLAKMNVSNAAIVRQGNSLGASPAIPSYPSAVVDYPSRQSLVFNPTLQSQSFSTNANTNINGRSSNNHSSTLHPSDVSPGGSLRKALTVRRQSMAIRNFKGSLSSGIANMIKGVSGDSGAAVPFSKIMYR